MNYIEILIPVESTPFMTTKPKDYIRRELRIAGILDKIDEYRWN